MELKLNLQVVAKTEMGGGVGVKTLNKVLSDTRLFTDIVNWHGKSF